MLGDPPDALSCPPPGAVNWPYLSRELGMAVRKQVLQKLNFKKVQDSSFQEILVVLLKRIPIIVILH